MTTVTLRLAPETEQRLRQQATRAGQTLETYLEHLAQSAAANGTSNISAEEAGEQPRYFSDPRPTGAELERLLGELAAGPSLPVLPPDFSRPDGSE